MVRHWAFSASLVLLTATTIAVELAQDSHTEHNSTKHDTRWPSTLSAEVRYYPEDEHLYKRGSDALDRLETQQPIGVRKMSNDPGEMFFFDYWVFASGKEQETEQPSNDDAAPVRDTTLLPRAPPSRDSDSSLGNLTAQLQAPFRPHSEEKPARWDSLRFNARNVFDKRNFQCPAGTSACNSINRPNSCCGVDETCIIVDDTGLGDVGCCPKGQKCGGTIAGCQTDLGYTSCPGSPNGGCCIPNFSCQDVGCIASSVSTTTRVVAAVTVTRTVTPNAVTTTSTTEPPPPTTPVATYTVYTTLPANTTTVLVPASSATECGSNLNSCAASLGGGCCPSDRTCVSGGGCRATSISTSSSSMPTPTSSTESGAGAPVRPTSDQDSSTSTSTSLAGPSVCPTGYYMCSARYVGGCCQVDRQCHSTSCLGGPRTTVNSLGATIVVPAGDATGPVATANAATTSAATTTMTAANNGGGSGCATGWFGCAMDQGGGCCPSGYACGASCAKVAGVGPTQVNKLPPISAANTVAHGIADATGLWMALMALLLGSGMVLL